MPAARFLRGHSARCIETHSAGEMCCGRFVAAEHPQGLAPALLHSFLEGKGTAGYLGGFRGRLSCSAALSC